MPFSVLKTSPSLGLCSFRGTVFAPPTGAGLAQPALTWPLRPNGIGPRSPDCRMRPQSRSSRGAPPRPLCALALTLLRGPGRGSRRFLPRVVSQVGHGSVSCLACSRDRTHLRRGPLPEARRRKLSAIAGVLWRKCCPLRWWRRELAVGLETGRSVWPQLGASFHSSSTTAPFSSPEPGAVARGAPLGSLTLLQEATTWASPGPPARGLAPSFSFPGRSKKCPGHPAPCPPPRTIETLVQSDSPRPGTTRIQNTQPRSPSDGALQRL